jgi:hypothetical protein
MSHHSAASHDVLINGQVATCLTMHGDRRNLTRLIEAIDAGPWHVAVVSDPTPAEGCRNCHDAYVIVLGHLSVTELHTAVTGMGSAPLLPPPNPN